MKLTRRKFLTQTSLLIATTLLPWSFAIAQAQRIRVGLMLPYSGTYAQLGTAITNGFKLAVTERSGKLGGRELEYLHRRRRSRTIQGAGEHQQAGPARQG